MEVLREEGDNHQAMAIAGLAERGRRLQSRSSLCRPAPIKSSEKGWNAICGVAVHVDMGSSFSMRDFRQRHVTFEGLHNGQE